MNWESFATALCQVWDIRLTKTQLTTKTWLTDTKMESRIREVYAYLEKFFLSFWVFCWKSSFGLNWSFEFISSTLLIFSSWGTRNNILCRHKITLEEYFHCCGTKLWSKTRKHEAIAKSVLPWKPWYNCNGNTYFHNDPRSFYHQHYTDAVD